MRRRFNYSNRKKIRHESVQVATRESGGTHVATVNASLAEYGLPSDALVFVEAYRKANYMREKIGTVSTLPDPYEFVLRDFDTVDGVKFRLKVVDGREHATKSGQLLLGVADRITPKEGDDEDANIKKLLKLEPADLNGEIWRVSTEEDPVIQIEKVYWEDRSTFVRSGWFFSIVMPAVLRTILTSALSDQYRELEDDDWRAHWLRFALSLPSEGSLPSEDADEGELSGWVDIRVEAFCRHQKVQERFEAIIRGSE